MALYSDKFNNGFYKLLLTIKYVVTALKTIIEHYRFIFLKLVSGLKI